MGFIGSGRHRRPTQTERAVAAAGVAGAGLAIPLLTATGAHAAPVTTWDAVAQCATAGNWTKATGDGTYGGLQLDLRTWVAYGGDLFASTPDRATKDEQITVAERVLADNGAKVWGKCATTAGLTGEGKPETVVPTETATPAPTTTARGAAPVFPGMQGKDANGVYWYQAGGQWYWTTSQEIYDYWTGPGATRNDQGDNSGNKHSATPPTPSAPTTALPPTDTVPGTPGATTPAPGTTPGTLPGTTAPTATDPTTGQPVTGVPPVTDPVGAATGPAAPASTDQAPAAATTAPQDSPGTPEATTYTVAAGDTLSDISDKNKLGGWKHVYDSNESTIGENPDLIKPGQVLKIK
ncbi:transglycosylase family protein [Kitasatospora sp. NPDC051914]|uniref:LysM peptidoglycan-binding domain-containing protein n=1 Tax=Kitasatospora sp. NPDC051914 TaxID=3154945 RepID=UPI0034424B39